MIEVEVYLKGSKEVIIIHNGTLYLIDIRNCIDWYRTHNGKVVCRVPKSKLTKL